MEKKIRSAEACVHCHLCRENCAFLEKYGIDIGDTEELRDLAYHCFLCGTCSRVCPKGIDGREIILDMRREQTEGNGGRPAGKGYGGLLWEKDGYRFRNYRNVRGKSALFPGCNFSSFYPRTTRHLARLLEREAGIGVIFDCCGKPIAELGMRKREETIIRELDRRLEEAGVQELIMVCPNCYHFLKNRLNVRIVSVYEKLRELGLGRQIPGKKRVFPPCPDKEKLELLDQIRPFLAEDPEILGEGQCCGLGGCGAIREPDLAKEMSRHLGREGEIAVYCASCGGNYARQGYETAHLLAEILETEEMADTKLSLLNRMKTKYWRKK